MPPLPLPDPQLSDGVATLRPWHRHDAAALLREVTDDETVRWTTIPQPYTLRHALEWIEGSGPAREAGEALRLAIERAETGALAGGLDLRVTSWEHGRGEFGYVVYRSSRGHGLAARSVRLLTEWAFAELPLDRLEIYAEPGNERSLRVAEQAGFVREGVLRSYHRVLDHRSDRVVLARVRGD